MIVLWNQCHVKNANGVIVSLEMTMKNLICGIAIGLKKRETRIARLVRSTKNTKNEGENMWVLVFILLFLVGLEEMEGETG